MLNWVLIKTDLCNKPYIYELYIKGNKLLILKQRQENVGLLGKAVIYTGWRKNCKDRWNNRYNLKYKGVAK